ncbi:MAG: DNA polymerase IV [Anaerovoracaceae bacterium]
MTVLQVDANSAYLSWTAAYMLEKGCMTDIREIPSVIAGDPKNRHGIIMAKSIPAKRAGIKTGASLSDALKKCPSLAVYPPDFDLYLSCSDAMYSILREYSSLIERFSIDECYMEYQRSREHGSDPVDEAFEIKDRIKEELGFTVNVGVGANKLLAKMACELEKPDRVHVLLTHDDIEKKLWPLDVSELFMVGRMTSLKLKRMNIRTIGDLAAADPNMLVPVLKSYGPYIRDLANGIDDSPIVPIDAVPEKNIGNSMTIRYDLTDPGEARAYLLSLCERVCWRLRKRGFRASVVTVGICSSEFWYHSHQRKLPFFTDDTSTVYHYACSLFEESWDGSPIRKLGVRAGGLNSSGIYQLTFFDAGDCEKAERLNTTVDRIRARYGQTAIYRGLFANSPLRPIEGGVNNGDYIMMGGHSQ